MLSQRFLSSVIAAATSARTADMKRIRASLPY
jgi:hypothetical protein